VKKRLGRNAHVDKSDWKYFDASIVMNAHNQQGNLPGTNEPVYGPMKACLRQPVTQQFFRNFINSVQNSPRPQKKIAPPSTRKPSPKIKQTHKVTRKVTPRIKATHKVTRKITPRIKPTHKVKRKGVTKIKQTHKVRKMSSAKIKRNHRTNKRTAYKRSKISQRRWRR
jgi:hypothetical protein